MLLYQKVTPSQVANSEVAASLELSSCVHKKLQEIINHDNKLYEAEERKRLLSKSNLFSKSKSNSQFSWSNDKSSNSKFDKDDNDEDDGSNLNDSSFNKDSGPRIVFWNIIFFSPFILFMYYTHSILFVLLILT